MENSVTKETPSMRSFPEFIEKHRENLFQCMGRELSCSYPQCESLLDAQNLITSEYTGDAIVDACNDLSNIIIKLYGVRDNRWNKISAVSGKACDQVVEDASHRLPEALSLEAFKACVQLHKNVLNVAWIEEAYEIPQELRIFEPLDRILLIGHIVCGWDVGVYPDGNWVVW